MVKYVPQDCINNKCKSIIYVSPHQLGFPLQCQECIDKREKEYEKEDNESRKENN